MTQLIIACGRAGTRIVAGYALNPDNFPTVNAPVVYIDTTDRDEKEYRQVDAPLYVIGSGSERSEINKEVPDIFRDIMGEYPDTRIVYIVSSGSGGSGAMIASEMFSLAIEKGLLPIEKGLLPIMVNSITPNSNDRRLSTYNHLLALEDTTLKNNSTRCIVLRNTIKEGGMANTARNLLSDLLCMISMLSDGATPIDGVGIRNFLNPGLDPKLEVHSGLYKLSVVVGNYKGNRNILSVFTLYPAGSDDNIGTNGSITSGVIPPYLYEKFFGDDSGSIMSIVWELDSLQDIMSSIKEEIDNGAVSDGIDPPS